MKTSAAGRAAIWGYEGFRANAYLCSAGVPTLGVGHTRGVKMGMACTEQQAREWLAEDLADAETAVNALVKVPLSQDQFDALVSFVFNLGAENFKTSTLLKHLNAGRPLAAAGQFKLWCKAGGKVVNGLVKRRASEAETFIRGTKGEA